MKNILTLGTIALALAVGAGACGGTDSDIDTNSPAYKYGKVFYDSNDRTEQEAERTCRQSAAYKKGEGVDDQWRKEFVAGCMDAWRKATGNDF
ncbi:hypothetical protein [Actinomadura atramentaria]|uniref:hypothetical protein n=1 Tax=Actinomadura atramentaria TaxID=1990 RepID=UPI00037E1492|nr:hypothetical protein [Actinomadura atramentaria]